MKKTFLMVVAMIMAFTATIMAQTPSIEQSRFFDETYVGVNVGYGAKVHSWDWQGLNLGLRWGKWFTPQIGAEFEGGIQFSDNSTNRVIYHRVGVNALLNLDYLNGYHGYRNLCEVVPFVGIGWQRNYQQYHTPMLNTEGTRGYYKAYPENAMYTKMGVHVDFNLDNGWQVNVIPSVAYQLTPTKLQYNVNRLDLGLAVGVTYNFKNSHGSHWFAVCDKMYTQAQWDELMATTNELRENNALLRAALEECLNRPKDTEVIKETTVITVEETNIISKPVFATIGFEKNSDKILGVYELNIRTIADYIKESDKHFTVIGFASEEGDNEYNQQLSLRRAEAVANALIGYGVDATRIHTEGKGATEEFGTTRDLNRTVQIVAE